jgi:hypothetical protein
MDGDGRDRGEFRKSDGGMTLGEGIVIAPGR